jgi:hypothetical protein
LLLVIGAVPAAWAGEQAGATVVLQPLRPTHLQRLALRRQLASAAVG